MKTTLSFLLTTLLFMPALSHAQEVSVGIQSRQIQGALSNVEREVQGVRAYVEGALNRITACGADRMFYDKDNGCIPLWSMTGSETYFNDNVGIGVSNPATALHVDGVINVSDGASQRGLLDFDGSGFHVVTANASNLLLGTNNATRMTIDSAGNVGIGITPTSLFHVNGDGRFVGDVHAAAFYYSSDRNLKKDFVPLDGLAIINSLNGYHFKWRANDQEDVGVVAQEVEEVLPELVKMDADGNRKVDYSRLVAPLIEAVKQLSQRVEELERAQAE